VDVTAFIGVGANIEPERNLRRALDLLRERTVVTGVSTVYRTTPLRHPEQPPFLNGVFRIDTGLPPQALKSDVCRAIEDALGRVRSADPWAPREMDLDIALYGDVVLDTPDLRIPDPEIRERPFLAAPMLELEPDLVLPDTGEALADVVARMDLTGMVSMCELTKALRVRLAQ